MSGVNGNGRGLIEVSRQTPKREFVPPTINLDAISLSWFWWWRKCGHWGPRCFQVRIHYVLLGWTAREGLTREQRTDVTAVYRHYSLCPACELDRLRSEVKLCAICNHPIFPEQVASLVSWSHPAVQSNATLVGEDKVLCCFTCDGDVYGRWTGKEFLPAK